MTPANWYDLTFNVLSLTPGTFYRFGLVAENEIGKSEMSDISSFAAATNPAVPTVLEKVVEKSNKTSIYL